MKKYKLSLLIILIIIIDYLFNKNILNIITLLSGLLSILSATKNKKKTYIYGLINSIFSSYILYINNLHILKLLTILIIIPSHIIGIFIYSNNKKIKSLNNIKTLYKLLTIISICIILIHKNLLTALDLISSLLNITGLTLLILKFKECWNIWLINNIIDLYIWINLLTLKSSNAFIMIIICIIYLIINIDGIQRWKKL